MAAGRGSSSVVGSSFEEVAMSWWLTYSLCSGSRWSRRWQKRTCGVLVVDEKCSIAAVRPCGSGRLPVVERRWVETCAGVRMVLGGC